MKHGIAPNHDGIGDSRTVGRNEDDLTQVIAELAEEFGVEPNSAEVFKPRIRYDAETDRVEMRVMDSVDFGRYEVISHQTPRLTLLELTPLKNDKICVGFWLDGVQKFCTTRNLRPSTSGEMQLSRILRFMTVLNGTSASSPIIWYILLPLLAEYKIDRFSFGETK